MCPIPPIKTSTSAAAPEQPAMTLNLGDLAPDFTAETADGEIRFHEWLGQSWGVLFSHPADFTPVCTTELGAVARLHDQFAARDTKVAAVSVDPAESHRAWATDIAETQGAEVNFPLIADPDRRVATLYGMIHPRHDDTATVRSVFIIAPDKKVKLTLTYPASTGRHFGEILRVLDSLQLTAAHQLATPADWEPGEDVIITPAVPQEEAARRFPNHRVIKPYLRLTAQPGRASSARPELTTMELGDRDRMLLAFANLTRHGFATRRAMDGDAAGLAAELGARHPGGLDSYVFWRAAWPPV